MHYDSPALRARRRLDPLLAEVNRIGTRCYQLWLLIQELQARLERELDEIAIRMQGVSQRERMLAIGFLLLPLVAVVYDYTLCHQAVEFVSDAITGSNRAAVATALTVGFVVAMTVLELLIACLIAHVLGDALASGRQRAGALLLGAMTVAIFCLAPATLLRQASGGGWDEHVPSLWVLGLGVLLHGLLVFNGRLITIGKDVAVYAPRPGRTRRESRSVQAALDRADVAFATAVNPYLAEANTAVENVPGLQALQLGAMVRQARHTFDRLRGLNPPPVASGESTNGMGPVVAPAALGGTAPALVNPPASSAPRQGANGAASADAPAGADGQGPLAAPQPAAATSVRDMREAEEVVLP